jgi:hypothetical protein
MKKWKTKDGRELSPEEMSDSHLVNTLRMLWKKKVDLKIAQIYQFCFGPQPRGDGASEGLEQEIIRLERMSVEEWFEKEYDFLIREAKKRKLDWSAGTDASTSTV